MCRLVCSGDVSRWPDIGCEGHYVEGEAVEAEEDGVWSASWGAVGYDIDRPVYGCSMSSDGVGVGSGVVTKTDCVCFDGVCSAESRVVFGCLFGAGDWAWSEVGRDKCVSIRWSKPSNYSNPWGPLYSLFEDRTAVL